MTEVPDSEGLFFACTDLIEFLEENHEENRPYYLEHFIKELFEGETPKMALVIAKNLFNDRVMS